MAASPGFRTTASALPSTGTSIRSKRAAPPSGLPEGFQAHRPTPVLKQMHVTDPSRLRKI
jgi:hypothetical protein